MIENFKALPRLKQLYEWEEKSSNHFVQCKYTSTTMRTILAFLPDEVYVLKTDLFTAASKWAITNNLNPARRARCPPETDELLLNTEAIGWLLLGRGPQRRAVAPSQHQPVKWREASGNQRGWGRSREGPANRASEWLIVHGPRAHNQRGSQNMRLRALRGLQKHINDHVVCHITMRA